jgi:hypothetical protein
MRPHAFSRFLAFCTGGLRRGPASDRPWQDPFAEPPWAAPSPPVVHFSPEQLDRLAEIVMPVGDLRTRDRSPVWDGADTDPTSRDERFLRVVDRAIADIAAPRRVRTRPRW